MTNDLVAFECRKCGAIFFDKSSNTRRCRRCGDRAKRIKAKK